jgi:hypothetical protein
MNPTTRYALDNYWTNGHGSWQQNIDLYPSLDALFAANPGEWVPVEDRPGYYEIRLADSDDWRGTHHLHARPINY